MHFKTIKYEMGRHFVVLPAVNLAAQMPERILNLWLQNLTPRHIRPLRSGFSPELATRQP